MAMRHTHFGYDARQFSLRMLLASTAVLATSAIPLACRSPAAPTPAEADAALSLPWPPTPRPQRHAGIDVTLSTTTLELEGRTVAPVPPEGARNNGFDASVKRGGPHDLFLVPLAAAAAAIPRENRTMARVTVDGSIPYRMLTEVLITLGQAEVGTFDLGLMGPGAARIVFHPPKAGGVPPDPAEPPKLHLTAVLLEEGVSLKASGAKIAPGCDGVGPGITIPRPSPDAPTDLAAVVACARKAKESSPRFASETEVIVSASHSIPTRQVVDLVLALQGTKEAPLFPDVSFAIAR